MPKISQGFSTTTITLPSYEGSEVVLNTVISVDDLLKTESLEGLYHSAGLLQRLIASWNFEEEDGSPLAITVDNIIKFPAPDLNFMMKAIMPYLQKKTEASGKTSSSTPSEAEDTSL